MTNARRCVLIVTALLSSTRAHADKPESTTDSDLDQRIAQEATSGHRARMAAGGIALSLGGVVTGMAVLEAVRDSQQSDPNVTVHHDTFFTYVALGCGLFSIATGVFALAVDTPMEHVYEATRHASALQQRQAIAVEAHAVEHRRSIMRGVGIGFLAASAGAFIAFAATGHDINSSAGEALVLGGAGGGAAGLVLTLSSFARSPVEKMNDGLPQAEMMPATSQAALPRVSAGIVPTRGGALLGFGAAF